MNATELKKAIAELVNDKYMNKIVDFGTDAFKVKNTKIRVSKRAIKKSEFDDYGVDENTTDFVIVEFWDKKNEHDVESCVCAILTINKFGQVGSADVPLDFDCIGVDLDFTLAMTDEIKNYK